MAPEARSDVETISLRVVYLRIISSFSRQTISKYCAVAESFRLRPVRSRAQSVAHVVGRFASTLHWSAGIKLYQL